MLVNQNIANAIL